MIADLEKLGLTKGESRVYEALLKLGVSTVGPVVKSSKVVYSKIYDVLQRLMEKGLASYIVKEKTRYYKAAPPTALKDYLKIKDEELKRNKELLNKLLPSLESLHEEDQQDTQIFFGHKGILAAYEIMLKSTKENGVIRYFYSDSNKYHDKVKEFYINRPQFHDLLEDYFKKNKITWQALGDKKSAVDPGVKYMDLKYVNFPLPGNIDFSEDYVMLTTWGVKPMAILIKSKEVASNFTEYFDSIWSIAK